VSVGAFRSVFRFKYLISADGIARGPTSHPYLHSSFIAPVSEIDSLNSTRTGYQTNQSSLDAALPYLTSSRYAFPPCSIILRDLVADLPLSGVWTSSDHETKRKRKETKTKTAFKFPRPI